jgi:hypothetical protein
MKEVLALLCVRLANVRETTEFPLQGVKQRHVNEVASVAAAIENPLYKRREVSGLAAQRLSKGRDRCDVPEMLVSLDASPVFARVGAPAIESRNLSGVLR